jgi:hypothetical protein
MILIYWEKTNISCEGNERGVFLFASNEFNPVENREVKSGEMHKTEVCKQVFLFFFNIWEQP